MNYTNSVSVLSGQAQSEPGTMTLDGWREHYRKRLPAVSESDSTKFGFFAINLKYGRRKLIEEFATQLTLLEGKGLSSTPPIEMEILPTKKRSGRRGIRDALNALGMMRLRYHCNSFAEAQIKMKPFKGKGHGSLWYEQRHSANRACNLALRHFQKIIGWFDSKEPIWACPDKTDTEFV